MSTARTVPHIGHTNMAIIKINRRAGTGWLEAKTPNIDPDYCDICHKQLWIAPDGTLYCNTEDCGTDYMFLHK